MLNTDSITCTHKEMKEQKDMNTVGQIRQIHPGEPCSSKYCSQITLNFVAKLKPHICMHTNDHL